jgi:hypothetical protein
MATPTGQARDPAMAGSWRTRWAAPPRTAYTSETKPFFLTSEFLAFVLFLMGLGISAATSPQIDAWRFWVLATIATSAYMISRGIAKAASRSRARDPREDVDLGRPEGR